ncbi:cytochrome c oxidase accessory protein CcoG [Marinobacter adhaerens]|jgi:cytochrome c oxidase accessory protein FixG|uniref:Cytochrome c oxidase accessory protein CcoG n=2 Tax=Marinobacter adhaerens TaxID=1033846 RepID=A0ABX8ID18_9GAMM|nr:cytochrome c oxidase accessory protein CcoG [Marinobacter adhaerens]ADP97452.1 iron-sulfur cluster-binding protein [Marinobacter adhaerens HP15]MBW4978596.1 cytochrome c oxidase accessory protein CcoG [Marinobacter adhaerens]QWV11533.1 cytochrome c oxidase accessory protein CcoG [Marinobacter adhaerens]
MSQNIPLRNIDTVPDRPTLMDKIHTRSFKGYFRRLRILGGALLFALYFGTVWLTSGDRQAVLWDLSEKQFHIFGSTFWPQDLVLLSAILIICAVGLFFLTVLAGRVWCGYTCPQSVWMWIFMWAEKVTEGDRNQRIKLDQAPMSIAKFFKRARKHTLWLLISLATAVTFVGYFTPIRELLPNLITMDIGATALFWVFFFTVATYTNAGWLREKVCLHMCPYGRFQSSMLDQDSLVITYDAARGESRGPRKKGADYKSEGLGDCIDCQMCVQVCPTGIDIRDGLQMECIACAACIDACDSVMEKMAYGTGLIRYTSERALNGGGLRIVRPRMLGYAVVLLAMISALSWAFVSRPMLTLDIEKDRGLFRYNTQGHIENSYVLKILNKSQHSQSYNIGVSGVDGLQLSSAAPVSVGARERVELPITVSVAPESLETEVSAINFHLQSVKDPALKLVANSKFVGTIQ